MAKATPPQDTVTITITGLEALDANVRQVVYERVVRVASAAVNEAIAAVVQAFRPNHALPAVPDLAAPPAQQATAATASSSTATPTPAAPQPRAKRPRRGGNGGARRGRARALSTERPAPDEVLAFIRGFSNPLGPRMAEMSEGLHRDTRAIRPVLNELLEARRIAGAGTKQGMRYTEVAEKAPNKRPRAGT